MEIIVHLLELVAGILLSISVAIVLFKLKKQVVSFLVVSIAVIVYVAVAYYYREFSGLQFIIAGASFGYVSRKFSFQRYFELSTILLFLSFMIVHYIYYNFKGIDLVANNHKLLQQIIEDSTLEGTKKAILVEQLHDFIPTLQLLVPFTYFFNAVILSVLMYVLCYIVFVRYSLFSDMQSTFSLFFVSEWVVFILIGSWAIVLLGKSVHYVWKIALNVGLILCVVYTIQGLSIVNFYFEKRRWPKVYGLALLAFASLLGFQVLFFVVTMLMGLGVIDFWMNFRKIS